jgi:type IV pilus assembly protein PilW
MKCQSNFLVRQAGFSLIETMVGIVIGLIAILVIYQVLSTAEGIKRNTTGSGDAQQSGLLSTFTMSLQFANAGSNLSANGLELEACPYYAGVVDDLFSNADANAKMLRPVPVLIKAGSADDTSDEFFVNYGVSQRVVTPVSFATTPTSFAPSADFTVQSPLGFKQGDVVMLIQGASGSGRCALSVVTAPPTDSASGSGFKTITHSVPIEDSNADYASDSQLLNLGPLPRRVRFNIDATNNSLQTKDLLDIREDGAHDSPAVPIASNIINMKVQYGIGDPDTGHLQKWVKADNSSGEDWSPAAVLAMDHFSLSRIVAIRIGLVVQSEAYDKDPYPASGGKFEYTLFAECGSVPCPDPIDVTIPVVGPSLTGNFRYRVLETVIPIRNAVWNPFKTS